MWESCVSDVVDFRDGSRGCCTRWGDARFELTDAVLCSPHGVGSVPELSLEPVFRRSHGSLYKALARGRIDEDRLRRLLVANRGQRLCVSQFVQSFITNTKVMRHLMDHRNADLTYHRLL